MADKRTKAQLLAHLESLESTFYHLSEKNDLQAKQIRDLEAKLRRALQRGRALADAADFSAKAASAAANATRELSAALAREC